MSDILKQIQELQEQFDNLFEVDGLGNPAVDVPPSQNKIKKDRKTKDGKVEVVSVEDELFPYEGNKREQFRQKVIATINNMIQGTATLEDLLQLVRQKKAPLKEAMELMEDINNYVRRVHGEPNEVNKSGKLLDKAASIKMREHNKAAGKAAADKLGISMDDEEWWKDENNRKKYQKEFEKQSEEIFKKRKVKNYKTVPNSADFVHGKEWTGEPLQKKAPLKEAMELMEDIHKTIRQSDKTPSEKSKLSMKAMKAQADELVGAARREKRLATDILNRRESSLKEAMELMEDLFSTILKQPDEKQGALVYKYHQAKNKENAGKDTYTQAKEEEKRKSKEEKGQEKTEQRKKYRGKSTEDWKQGRLMDQIAKNAAKLAKVSDSTTAKAIRRNAQKADLKEALEIMEAIINEVSDKTANSFLEKRVKNAVDAWYNDDKLNKKEDDAVKALIKRKARQGAELSDDEKKRIEEAIINELNTAVVNNALNKRIDQSIEADDKDREEFNNILKIKDRDKRAKAYAEFKKKTYDRLNKENKKLDIYAKFAKKHPELLKEALELMEEIISEVSNKTVENALTKANDKVVSGLFSFTGVDMNDVKKAKKLRELADRRAKRHGEKIEEDPDTGEHRHIKEALNILIEGRKEGESQEDFKHRLHGELVRAIDNKAVKAREEAIEGKKGAYEKYKKEHDKLGKLDDIEPVANAYCEALDKAEEVAKKLNELFDRPDLLDDIDTMLGSPVKKAKNKILKQILEPKKEKKEEKKTEKKATCSKK